MPFGHSYGIYKIVQKTVKLTAKFAGASESSADKIGTAAGAYAGGWAAIITVDPAGGIAVATDVADKVFKGGPDPSP